ncbi:hypothetical protein [Sphingomonas bacterium]|uniref:hypothetical protein n=1 Tax=Sphingomonas bacterium TaxID=1895847 RepID=UPI00261B2C75|nr:hypothetical protein [Sphingomonas bacterium]MDB5677082.1 hypothetical protein [Sphingomonas bacterium]
MTPKIWQMAALVSILIAAVILGVSGSSNILRMLAIPFVFLALWLTNQRHAAERLERHQKLSDDSDKEL